MAKNPWRSEDVIVEWDRRTCHRMYGLMRKVFADWHDAEERVQTAVCKAWIYWVDLIDRGFAPPPFGWVAKIGIRSARRGETIPGRAVGKRNQDAHDRRGRLTPGIQRPRRVGEVQAFDQVGAKATRAPWWLAAVRELVGLAFTVATPLQRMYLRSILEGDNPNQCAQRHGVCRATVEKALRWVSIKMRVAGLAEQGPVLPAGKVRSK